MWLDYSDVHGPLWGLHNGHREFQGHGQTGSAGSLNPRWASGPARLGGMGWEGIVYRATMYTQVVAGPHTRGRLTGLVKISTPSLNIEPTHTH